MKNVINAVRRSARKLGSNVAKVGAGATALVASGAALAQTTTPGGAIAGELAGGKTEMGLVFAAVAVLIGALLVWAYIRRSAK